MSGTVRSVPLIERRADARVLDENMKRHLKDCRSCGVAKCGVYRGMKAELAKIREELRTWFAPGPDDQPLF